MPLAFDAVSDSEGWVSVPEVRMGEAVTVMELVEDGWTVESSPFSFEGDGNTYVMMVDPYGRMMLAVCQREDFPVANVTVH